MTTALGFAMLATIYAAVWHWRTHAQGRRLLPVWLIVSTVLAPVFFFWACGYWLTVAYRAQRAPRRT